MVVALLLVFLRYGGVSIKSVSLLGTELIFNNIQALYASTWILFFYYLIRYYQYFRQETQRPFHNYFWARFDSLSQRALKRRALKLSPNTLREYSGDFLVSQLERHSLLSWRGQTVVGQSELGDYKRQYYQVKPILFLPQAARATLSAALNTSAATDYFFPYALSFAAFWYGFAGPWEGSFCSAFSLPC